MLEATRDGGTLRIPVAECFAPLLEPARWKGAWGGRGGGKDHFFCGQLIEDAQYERGMRSVCIREIQKTLRESVKFLLEKKLSAFGLGESDGFKVFNEVIATPGDGIITFTGMQSHNAESFKSYEGFKRLYCTEAQQISKRSIQVITPTMRTRGAEMWWAWNPKLKPPRDPKTGEPDYQASIDGILRYEPPPGAIVVEAQYDDNPWFYSDTEMPADEEYARRHLQPEDYNHIWRGAYETRSEARVFHNWRSALFETATAVQPIYRFGADFGFAIDPTCLVRMFLGRWLTSPDQHGMGGVAIPDENGRTLFIDYEAYRIGCDVDFTPALFAGSDPRSLAAHDKWKNPFGDPGIPQAMRWKITADSANPQTISYLARHGFNIEGAIKGQGSIEEGVNFLKSYDIVIHERCAHTIDEFTLYSFKTDEKTGLILPVLEDKKNHVIDSCRYALEDVRRGRGFFG